MHITVETAALLAQVFPALLIAILIEGRLRISRRRRLWVIRMFLSIRIAAIFSTAGATFVCLLAVIARSESLLIDVMVNVAFYTSAIAMLIMISDVFDRQLEESKQEFWDEVAADSQRRDQRRLIKQYKW